MKEFCCFPPWGEELRPSLRQSPRACLFYRSKRCRSVARAPPPVRNSPLKNPRQPIPLSGSGNRDFVENCLAVNRSSPTFAVHLSLGLTCFLHASLKE